MGKYKNALAMEKKQREPAYNMTAAQLAQAKRAAQREGLRAGIWACNAMYSAAMLQGLRDGLGFGAERLKRIFERVQMLFNQIVAGEISYEDMAAVLREECGIALQIERPEGTPVDAEDMFRDMAKAQNLAQYGVKIK